MLEDSIYLVQPPAPSLHQISTSRHHVRLSRQNDAGPRLRTEDKAEGGGLPLLDWQVAGSPQASIQCPSYHPQSRKYSSSAFTCKIMQNIFKFRMQAFERPSADRHWVSWLVALIMDAIGLPQSYWQVKIFKLWVYVALESL